MKKRYKPHALLAYEALFRRLHPTYRTNDIIQSDYLKLRAGYQGEQNLDYKLGLFPRNDFLHLPDIRLKQHNNFFQIDSIIITPKVVFNLEAKHMRGTLEYYGAERQLVQSDAGTQYCYKDPILQARTQARHLHYWLQQSGLNIPVEPLIVSTNQQTIIKNVDHHADFTNHFITLENLPFKLEKSFSSYNDMVLQTAEIQRLGHLLTTQHLPATTSLIEKFNIKQNHLIQGVSCPKCDAFPLQKMPRTWHCPACKYKGPADYKRVILDHFILWQHEYITNQMCRDILQINSSDSTYVLLKRMKLNTNGDNKGRKYFSPNLADFPQDAVPKKFNRSILDFKKR